jgi:hypothetical protein
MRKDRSFDDIIKDKLNNVTPTYQPENWERFKERLGNEFSNEIQDIEFFDRVVRQKTPATSNTGFSDNWSALVNRLDIIYRRERDLALSKLLELLALLLLFWVLETHLAPQSSEPALFAGNETTDSIGAPAKKPQDTSVAKSNNSSTPLTGENPSASVSKTDKKLQQTESAQQSGLETTQSIAVNSINDAAYQPAANYLVPAIQIQLPQPLVNQLELPQLESTIWGAMPEILPKNNTKRFYIGMFGSTDINSIHTPGSIEGPFSELDRSTISIPGLQRYALGYSGGAALGFGRGRWESEIGMIYTAKLYQARPVLYVTGSVSEGFSAEGLKDIELNMLAVPFQMKYNWLQQNGWRLYTSAGAALHVVLESNFLLTDQDAFRSSSFNLSLPNPEPGEAPKSKGLHSKNLDGGLLQGGGFANNAYITGIISAGVERRFINGWSVFLQPTYQHSLYYFSKGIGPDKDRIHTFSLMSGIRVRL